MFVYVCMLYSMLISKILEKRGKDKVDKNGVKCAGMSPQAYPPKKQNKFKFRFFPNVTNQQK